MPRQHLPRIILFSFLLSLSQFQDEKKKEMNLESVKLQRLLGSDSKENDVPSRLMTSYRHSDIDCFKIPVKAAIAAGKNYVDDDDTSAATTSAATTTEPRKFCIIGL